jgi:hypothetical protein
VAWGDNSFTTTRLPAVSADGAAVVIAIQGGDGARGNPNLRMVVKDRADAEVVKKMILTASEAQEILDGADVMQAFEARVAAANRWLGEQHAARRFAALTPLEIENFGTIDKPVARATGGGVTVEWQDSRLKITQSGKALVERITPKTWLVKDRPMYPGAGPDEVCHNPAFLKAAAVDMGRKIAVLAIGYMGTDSCWEPSDVQHVVAW